jgi:hypothetical protein
MDEAAEEAMQWTIQLKREMHPDARCDDVRLITPDTTLGIACTRSYAYAYAYAYVYAYCSARNCRHQFATLHRRLNNCLNFDPSFATELNIMPQGLPPLLRSTALIQVKLYVHLLLDHSDGGDLRYAVGNVVTMNLTRPGVNNALELVGT